VSALAIPSPSLVVMVGVSGSGKSSFAREHFGRYEIVSSDFCRGLVADDENDQDASKDAFELLGVIVGKRLARGRLTVVDATNVQPAARKQLLALAKAHDVLPVAIVLDVPDNVCIARNAERPDRDFGVGVVKRQAAQLRKSLGHLDREGFRRVHVLRGVDEITAASIARERLLNDRRDEHGPFDVVGDVHGCRSELESLLTELGYHLVRDDRGRAVDAVPPDGRRAIFLGDLVDRGPDSPGVLRLVMGMVAAGHALCLPGNHENKLVRALAGRKVTVSHGLERTLAQLDDEEADNPGFKQQVEGFCDGLVAHLVLDEGRLVVAHAGLKEAYHGRASGRVRSFALYGDTTGETDEYGLPVRYPWAEDYRGRAMVLYGHTPVPETVWVNNTLCLDTGCVFGGRLTALRYPEKEIVSVPAERVWYEPVKPLASSTRHRAPDQLDIQDVLGKRVVETTHHGRVTIREDNAAGAIEVMSRFALHPRWLPYLPPTMAPVATSRRADLLEHPDEAFAAYAEAGVTSLVCQEKHMGSRAVVFVPREATRDDPGAVYTRTGRSFFGPGETATLLDDVRTAVTGAGLWDELATGWLLLDCELLPWSAKAAALLKNQYAAMGAAARSSLPPALAGLEAAWTRGVDVSELLVRTRDRMADAAAFTEVYRRYCWSTNGVDGVLLAPFQVLASEGRTWAARDHGWHLDVADRLVAQAPDRFRSTRRLGVDTTDPASTEAAVRWWEELTSAGGEGMVVKPLANLTRTPKGLVQPGLKVRGREYLRLIYGPDYLRPDNLVRLRDRHVQHKRSLALREYALGLEALDRFVGGEPLWRVHEAVFAILALESEPVDPRL
jgi:protein phosphatase